MSSTAITSPAASTARVGRTSCSRSAGCRCRSSPAIARAVVDTVERRLWTPLGPRSLAPDDARYHGRYTGGPAERDRAYHNGPVWPWLAGAFVEAWLRVRGNTADAKREASEKFVEPLRARALGGHLAEIYEGDPPHRAVGCPFQAWSVAELIRLERGVLA